VSGLSLNLLGTRVRLDGPASLLDLFRVMFGWFTAPDASFNLSFRVDPASDGFRIRIEQDGRPEEHRFDTEDRVFGFVYARILDQVTRRDPDLLCVHAAALTRGGRGLALAAPSQHGKSTLALALSARGFTFFSDEVAPIRRSTRALLPFPMAVGCRPGTHGLLRDSALAGHAFEPRSYSGKMLYDPSAATAGGVDAAPLHAIVFIESAEQPEGGPRRHRLFLDPPSEAIADRIAAIDGVRSAETEAGGAAVVVEVEGGAWVAPAVEATLEGERVLVTAVEDLDLPAPDFEATPALDRLTTTEGILALFRHLRGFGAIRELVDATPGGFGALLIDLAGSLREVAFYRLTPGRLPEMIEAIEGVC